jgi:phosphocarrier protein
MYSRQTVIQNATGLHARPAHEFVAAASKYHSKISIRNLTLNNGEANVKSIVKLMILSLNKGSTIEITANGDDEKEAVDALISLVGSFTE